MKTSHRIRSSLLLLFLLSVGVCAQDDVMMQAFYWNPPVDTTNKNGFWYDTLRAKIPSLKAAGIRALWTPPPSKGNWGIVDMGYGIFDHYDLGAYSQKGTTETRFGSKAELLSLLSTAHSSANGPRMDVYADVILNHIYGDQAQNENNPAVKQYVFDQAFRNGMQYVPYPTNEVYWRLPNASAGDYYIQIKGYYLDWNASYTQRGYDLYINWTGATPSTTVYWESEPNNGNGQWNSFPGSGTTIRGHMQSSSDIDEFKFTLTGTATVEIRLTARKEGTNTQGQWEWQWADQTNGYYPYAIWYNGSNLATTSLQARTSTGISYVTHTGTGEPNHFWTYTDFHPVDNVDWLGGGGFEDEIVTNTKWFGNDLNTFSTTVQNRLIAWGQWLSNTIGFDGYRLDFVRGFQEELVAKWVCNLPLKADGSQPFIVGEYWTGYKYRLKNWVNNVWNNFTFNGRRADVDVFDFPLRTDLARMANDNGANFNIAWLNHSGMVRDDGGNTLSGTSIVNFIDNHDTGKESDKWLWRDWDMAYAYILFAEGRPCIFYPHYYGVTQIDNHDPTKMVTAPSSLRTELNKLMHARRTYLGGTMVVLSEVGNPWPSGDTWNVYVARRQGNGTKSGGILVLNNHETSTKGLWVDNAPAGYQNWAAQTLVNIMNPSETTVVQADGRVNVWAPPRGFSLWVKQSEYVPYSGRIGSETKEVGTLIEATIPDRFEILANYPNPFNPSTTIRFTLPEAGHVTVRVYNVLGQLVSTPLDERLQVGYHSISWYAGHLPSGTYIYTVSHLGQIKTGKAVLAK
ncbi:MAG TPA: T9SS type A sorting domain-containing protein [Bacteroidota bacterium]|nr:T9SS type A sorting domain-containing protein [Bacteroidota bacterium]